MAKLAANQVRIYLDEFDVSGFANAFDFGISQETPVSTCLSDSGPRRVVGNYDHKGSVNAFFDGDDAGFDEHVFVDLNTDENHYLSKTFGTAEGSPVYLAVVRLTDQPRSGGSGGAVLLNFSHEGSGAVARSSLGLLRSATITGAGNGTGRNMAATLSGTVFAVHFHLLAFTGTDITIKLQESSDNGGSDAYGDITGLTSGALTAVGVVRKTTTAATEAYKRVVTTTSAGFTSATILVAAGVQP